jgi:hypothetical protein
MIRVTSHHIKACDRELLKRYAKFVLSKLTRNSLVRKADIQIKVVKKEDLTDKEDMHDLKKYAAWCIHNGLVDGRRKFTIILAAAQVNKNAKKDYIRLKKVLIDLGHELVHTKQYMNNELFDYVSGAVRYRGEHFDYDVHDEENYYNSPWEIEAYGREWGLYRMFTSKLKEEAKAKK